MTVAPPPITCENYADALAKAAEAARKWPAHPQIWVAYRDPERKYWVDLMRNVAPNQTVVYIVGR